MDGNFHGIPEDFRELVENVKEVLNLPNEEITNQEIWGMLVECDLDLDKATENLLLSRVPFQGVKNKRDKKNKTNNTRDAQDGTLNRMAGSTSTSGPSSSNSDLTGGESKGMPTNSGEAVGSLSATSPVLSHQPPSNSELTNRETKRLPVSSGKAVSSLSVQSSKYGSFISGGRTMAEVLMGLSSSKESVTKAPAKDDCPMNEKPDASVIKSDVTRDQLVEPAPKSSQSLFDEDATPTKSDLTDGEAVDSLSTTSRIIGHQAQSNSNLVPISSGEAGTSNSFIESAATSDPLSESASMSNQNLRDEYDTFVSKVEKLLQTPASEYNENFPGRYASSFNMAVLTPTARGEQLQKSTSDVIKNLPDELLDAYQAASNNEQTPSESSPQMQNFETFPNVMSMPKQHNSTTASSVGRMPSISMLEALQKATDYVPQKNQVAMKHTMNSRYLPPRQNSAYMSPSALQQHGGGLNAYYHQSPAAMPPQSAINIVPSTNSSAYGFGTPDYNTANSRFRSLQFNSHLPPFQHQSRNSNVGPPQGHNNSRVQSESSQSPSSGQSQQVHQHDQRYRGFGYQRSSPDNEFLNQQNARRDPSDDPNQTQQQP